MTLTLTPETQAAIDQQIQAGNFGSAEEVVALGVNIIEGLTSEQLLKLLALRQEIEKGLQSAAEGRVKPMRVQDAIDQAQIIRSRRQSS